MQTIFAFVEYKTGEQVADWKLTIVDCTPMIDAGVTEEEDLEDWAIEKNNHSEEGYTMHFTRFFDDAEQAKAWAKENQWTN